MNLIFDLINKEKQRQLDNIELIASENFVSDDILKAQGSILTNKYAEGFPNKRYYGGCEYIDLIEQKAIDLAKELFNVKYANVQPHSGSQANAIVYSAILDYGDTILGMDLTHGGHLTHGSPVNFSGKTYNFIPYGVDEETEIIDYDVVRELAIKHKPKLILAGASAYSREIDLKKFKEIAEEVEALFMVDMAHIAGFVATGLHNNPCDFADVVTSTTHKTLRGPRGGLILSNNENLFKKIDSACFPGLQGGPLEHVIGAKAICFNEALQPEFKEYMIKVKENTSAMVEVFKMYPHLRVVNNGSDNHLLLLDITKTGMNGKECQELLDKCGITTNKNTIPYEKLSPFKTSGIRIGSQAITTRGFTKEECEKTAHLIAKILKKEINSTSARITVKNLVKNKPLHKK